MLLLKIAAMPVYEYRCNDCHRRITLYVRGFSEMPKAICTACGSENLTRLFSSFTMGKTDQDFYEDILSDRRLVQGMMANEPRALAEWSRRMEGAAGGEVGPEYGEMMERLEKGESWERVASDMQKRELATSEESESSELD
jgi:putative FmdB family regulatory protein